MNGPNSTKGDLLAAPTEALERRLLDLGAVQDKLLAEGRPQRAERATQRFMQRFVTERPARRRLPRLMALCGAAAAAGLLGLWLHGQGPALEASFPNGNRVAVGQPVRAPALEALPLGFSEGSMVLLQPKASFELGEVQGRRVRARLHRGRADMRITPGRGVRWTFEAGPFEVTVTGTAFSLSWAPRERTFQIRLEEGGVTVEGPLLEGARRVARGQSLAVDLGRGLATFQDHPLAPIDLGEIAIDTEPATAPRPSRPALRRESRRTGPEPTVPLRAEETASPSPSPSWDTLAARGDFGGAMAMVDRVGLETLCKDLDARALLRLADTARAATRDAAAVSTYNCLRRRFTGGHESALAAYMLGRIAFELDHDNGRATSWFRTYLDEAPRGPLAAAALGRLMESRHLLGDLPAARKDASRYLREFTGGPHTDLAKSLLATP